MNKENTQDNGDVVQTSKRIRYRMYEQSYGCAMMFYVASTVHNTCTSSKDDHTENRATNIYTAKEVCNLCAITIYGNNDTSTQSQSER